MKRLILAVAYIILLKNYAHLQAHPITYHSSIDHQLNNNTTYAYETYVRYGGARSFIPVVSTSTRTRTYEYCNDYSIIFTIELSRTSHLINHGIPIRPAFCPLFGLSKMACAPFFSIFNVISTELYG